MPRKKSLYITKSNALINAKITQKYTLGEAKTILWMISHFPKEIRTKDEISLGVKDYADIIGVSSTNIYRTGKKIAQSLFNKGFTIEDEDGDGWITLNWFSSISYKDGIFKFKVEEKLVPHIRKLTSRFTHYQLKNVLSLNSQYAIRLYELLVQYLTIGERKIEYRTLRHNIGLVDNELTQFSHFRKRVLDISQREINGKTDIRFEWEPIKKGRAIESIKFKIMRQEYKGVMGTTTVDEKMQAFLSEIGIADQVLSKLIVDFGIANVREKYEFIQFKLNRGDQIASASGFFVDSLVNNYDTRELYICLDNIKSDKLKKDINAKCVQISITQSELSSHFAQYDENYKQSKQDELKLLQNELDELCSSKKEEITTI